MNCMVNKQFNIKLSYLFSGIFVIIIGGLAILSIFMHCETSLHDYEQTKTITRHTPYIYCALAAFGICAFTVLCIVLERIFSTVQNPERISRGIFIGCGIVILAAGLFWIFFNDCVPTSDQRDVYAEARRIAGVLDGPFNNEYFSYFPRNRGITLFVAAAIKIFGDHLYSFRLINIAASLIAYFSICRTSRLVYDNPVVSAITSFMLMLFYPIFIYDSYVYGTLLSVAFTSLGLYGTVSYCKTGKNKYIPVIILSFPLGILMHQSAAIGLIASVIYLLMNGKGKTLLKNVLISIATVIMVALFMKGTYAMFDHITGTDPEQSSVPVTCTVYMGLTAVKGAAGPGSQDGSYTEVFLENNCDGEAANRDALQRIAVVMKEYLTGERSLSFFLEKTKFQWLDPTFGARKIIKMNDPNMGDPLNGEAFVSFYKSSFRSYVFKLSIGGMLLVYVCALITGVKTIRDIKAYPAAILIQLYVIGGFAFQLLWESLSRYCLGYFMWLIPEAAFGVYCVQRFIICQKNKRKSS